MDKNIILIGMPGSGKSTVGVILAKTLGYDFVDTDLLISKSQNMKLQKIIDTEGLQRFLDIESSVACGLKCTKTVVATGGSVICRRQSMEYLHSIGTVVYIDVRLENLKRRIRNIKTRGIAFEQGETLTDIYEKRTPLYRKYADITINVQDSWHIENVVEEIIENLSLQI